MKTPKLLYFSLNHSSVYSFYRYNEAKKAPEIMSFRLVPETGDDGVSSFTHASDLIFYLDRQESKDSLPNYVILDYISLATASHNDTAFSVSRAREIVLRAILKYPEINFLFDETRNQYNDAFNFVDFLFLKDRLGDDVFMAYHSFMASADVKKSFEAIRLGRDNLFDGSNLRYASRRYLHNVLKVKRYNFSLSEESRRDKLALCVEEEHSQNRFNSYALYASGFRVLPIVTATELSFFNSVFGKKFTNPSIILRDYDLQFPDSKGNSDTIDNQLEVNIVDYIRGVKKTDDGNDTYKWYGCVEHLQKDLEKINNEIKEARKKLDNSITEESARKELGQLLSKDTYSDEEKERLVRLKKFVDLIEQRNKKESFSFWNNLQNVSTVFVSKGEKDIEFCETIKNFRKKYIKVFHKEPNSNYTNHFPDIPSSAKIGKQVVRGIKKPVPGVYYPFHFFECICERYESIQVTSDKYSFIIRDVSKVIDERQNADATASRELKYLLNYIKIKYNLDLKRDRRIIKLLKHTIKSRIPSIKQETFDAIENKALREIELNKWEDELKGQAWAIDTTRANHDHGVPLDVYDLVQSMLVRAKHYYDIGKYIRAAVIATEVMELLNGFHEALMLRAYHLLSISENAIAMNVLGGNETILCEDAHFRIKKIRREIDRIMAREGDGDKSRQDFKDNVLNQIFSDCRNFCKEREYFDVEDCFVSAMGHVSDGVNILSFFNR